jgi:hypothetical protein
MATGGNWWQLGWQTGVATGGDLWQLLHILSKIYSSFILNSFIVMLTFLLIFFYLKNLSSLLVATGSNHWQPVATGGNQWRGNCGNWWQLVATGGNW